MTLPAVLATSIDLRGRIAAMRRSACAAAREAEAAARAAERTYVPFPLGLNLDIRTAPRFERWTDDTYWYVQGNRFVSKDEMESIRNAYYAQQRRRYGGG